MSGLFGSSSASVPEAPPAPTINDTEDAAQKSADELRRRRGMAATVLAGGNPASSTEPATNVAKLLGS